MITTSSMRTFFTVLALLLGAASVLSGAPVIKTSEQGLVIENGGLKLKVTYPLPVNAAKAKGNLREKTVSETGALLKYEGGGQVDLAIAGSDITLQVAGLPADTQTLSLTGSVEVAAVANGTWRFDGKSGGFPSAKTSGQLFQGNAQNVVITTAAGSGIGLMLPSSYQQLMDLRQFQKSEFFWQCWIPCRADVKTIVVQVAESSSNAPASASPAAAERKAEPDRQTYGQLSGIPADKGSGTRILKWPDGKKAAFLLGFDDSTPSHLTTVIPELEKRKMVGNFYINPGGTLFLQQKAKWEQAARSPFVVLHNHTYTHASLEDLAALAADLTKTNEAIYALTPHLPKPRLLCFRTPGGVHFGIKKPDLISELAKNQMIDRPWIDGPPLTMKTLPPVLATVDTALAKGGTGFTDFHGIGGDANVAPTEWFIALLDKLDEHRAEFWITDTISWYQYQEERKKGALKVVASDANEVRVSLTSTADPAFYNFPVTAAVEIPATWKSCVVTRGGKTLESKVVAGEVRFDAVPGLDEISVKPK